MDGNFLIGFAGVFLLFAQDVFAKLAGLFLICSSFTFGHTGEPGALAILLGGAFVVAIILKAVRFQKKWERFLFGPKRDSN